MARQGKKWVKFQTKVTACSINFHQFPSYLNNLNEFHDGMFRGVPMAASGISPAIRTVKPEWLASRRYRMGRPTSDGAGLAMADDTCFLQRLATLRTELHDSLAFSFKDQPVYWVYGLVDPHPMVVQFPTGYLSHSPALGCRRSVGTLADPWTI